MYIFTILAIVAIIWCAGVIVYCWVFGALAPNLSLFPEIDFASKSGAAGNGMDTMLRGLGNANSKNVENRIKGTTVYIGAARTDTENEDMVLLSTKGLKVETLQARRKYM